MRETVIWDVEFLTDIGAPQRFWCGPNDPDPVLVQIGAVKLGLEEDCPIGATFERIVTPRGRDGNVLAPSALFTKLTGIDKARIAAEGVGLAPALEALGDFANGARIWAWGNDEHFAVAISCYVAGIDPPLPVTAFGNATQLFQRAGLPVDDIHQLRSDKLAAHFGLPDDDLAAHDALGDALSTARALQHLLRRGHLAPNDFA
ncbi:exonuclease [Maritimibacter sp. DP4N28-5]|uniref:Exonuclease n=1 Tax=Maritimibacter dapengensis TaxID=2836868 RepID=A0ABS6SWX7_9RHOB|nr:exonuclease [Maritimibacter dapengensis]